VLDDKNCVVSTQFTPTSEHYNIRLPFSSASANQMADSSTNLLIDTNFLVSENDFEEMIAVDMAAVANRAVALKNAADGHIIVLEKSNITSMTINAQNSATLAKMDWTVSTTGLPQVHVTLKRVFSCQMLWTFPRDGMAYPKFCSTKPTTDAINIGTNMNFFCILRTPAIHIIYSCSCVCLHK